jgi:hypothetical protein
MTLIFFVGMSGGLKQTMRTLGITDSATDISESRSEFVLLGSKCLQNHMAESKWRLQRLVKLVVLLAVPISHVIIVLRFHIDFHYRLLPIVNLPTLLQHNFSQTRREAATHTEHHGALFLRWSKCYVPRLMKMDGEDLNALDCETENHSHLLSAMTSEPRFCRENRSLCIRGEQISRFMSRRTRFAGAYHSERLASLAHVNIFVHPRVGLVPELFVWTLPNIYGYCPHCRMAENASAAHVQLFHHSQRFIHSIVPHDQNTIYAMINMEAHSYFALPATVNNTIVISYLAASDLVVSYCCSFELLHRHCTVVPAASGLSQCKAAAPGVRPEVGTWCRTAHGGDLATCAFRLMPALLAAAGEDRSARPLAVAWVSSMCHRHGGYLAELMLHVPIDMLGKCYRTGLEDQHPALRLAEQAPLALEGGAQGLARGERKVVIGSTYRFYIGVENTVVAGYVTEKFFEVRAPPCCCPR